MLFLAITTACKYVFLFCILPYLSWLIYIRTSRFHVMLNRIPGPPCLPIVGNALRLGGGPAKLIEVAHVKWVKHYGDIYRLFVGFNNAFVMVTSPELVEPILKSNKLIEKGSSTKGLRQFLGDGLVTSGGETWKLHRRLINPSFHVEVLNTFMEIFNEQSQTFARILKERSQANQGKPVEVSLPAAQCTLDAICEAVLGIKINAQTTDSEFSSTIHRIGEIIIETQVKPWLRIPILSDFTSIGKDRNRALKFLNGFADKVINERKQYLEEQVRNTDYECSERKRLALIDLLLTASEEGKSLDLGEVRSEIYTFFFAGYDTTAVLVGWFLYLMAVHPGHQEKVRNELLDVFGDSDRNCSAEDLPALKYLDCCIKETLRLYPSVPAIERLATDDIQIGDYSVPKGSNILISILALHKHSGYFENPESFEPARFLPEESGRRHPYSYIPFSSGPRNCIGQRFALMEAKVILSTLLRKMTFSTRDACKPPVPSQQISLKPIYGIYLTFAQAP